MVKWVNYFHRRNGNRRGGGVEEFKQTNSESTVFPPSVPDSALLLPEGFLYLEDGTELLLE